MPVIGPKDKEYKTITKGVSYRVILDFYAWSVPYPIENSDSTAANRETISWVFDSGVKAKGCGITSVQYSRNKRIAGSMTIDYTGAFPSDVDISLGTWVVLKTSATNSADNAIVKFMGQVHTIESSYQANAEGRLVRKNRMVVREWCYPLFCPVRFHPTAKDKNSSATQTATDIENTLKARNEVTDKIGVAMMNVFVQPLVALSFVGGMSNNYSSVLSKFGLKSETMHLFSTVISRLPRIPDAMLENYFDFTGVDANKAWSTGFTLLLSGVQGWEKHGDADLAKKGLLPHDITLSGYTKYVNPLAKRPLSFSMIPRLIDGTPLFDILKDLAGGSGAAEVYADLTYIKKGKQVFAQPTIVVRDTPYTLKEFNSGDSGFDWTFFDTLPTVEIDPVAIMRVQTSQTLQNTANLIEMKPSDGGHKNLAVTSALYYYGTVTLGESQDRYGAQNRQINVRDIFLDGKVDTFASLKSSVLSTGDAEEKEVLGEIYTAWFNELSKKQMQWYSSAFLFPDCQLQIKDIDYYLSVGHNVAFSLSDNMPTYVGHCEQISQTLTFDENGRVTSTTDLQLSRLCLRQDKKCYPMPYSSITNMLNRTLDDTALDLSILFPTAEIKEYLVKDKGISLDFAKELVKKTPDKNTKLVVSKVANSATKAAETRKKAKGEAGKKPTLSDKYATKQETQTKKADVGVGK